MENLEISIPSVRNIQMLLEPIHDKLDRLENGLKNSVEKSKSDGYYRNRDLKNLFGLSPNTIIKYRETGILPYTTLGDVYLYEICAIEAILRNNSMNS